MIQQNFFRVRVSS